jgi:hypothetical protein
MDFIGYDIGVAITGREEVGLTLILTEGFGEMAMQERIFELFQQFEGQLACINGATQIRAGVIRPEVIVPRPETTSPTSATDDTVLATGLIPGTLIRLIREPYFGEMGKVTSLPVALYTLESESQVRVLEVELDDGERVVVPRANVEIIEE